MLSVAASAPPIHLALGAARRQFADGDEAGVYGAIGDLVYVERPEGQV